MKNFGTFLTFNNGHSNNIFYKLTFQRNSIDKPIFETRGSKISLSGQFTPPYSSFNSIDYDNPLLSDQDRYKYVEYQKYKFTLKHFIPITNKKPVEGKEVRNLILMTSAGYGFLSPYNTSTGTVPFERFSLGGSGLVSNSLGGMETIAMRGYADNGSLSPDGGGAYIAKYSMELRFPLTLNPSATIYILGFADAGNSWNKAKDFDPFDIKRSTGFGVRIFLPMFGMIGFDYGVGLDNSKFGFNKKGQIHFTIGASVGEL
jgi:outer membrane protein insertion porin family